MLRHEASRRLVLAAVVLLAGSASCPQPAAEETLFENAADSLEGVLTRSGIELDAEVSSDGKGSFKIVADASTTVRLFEIEGIEAENVRLSYRARIRTEGVEGHAYLEMWCRVPGQGEFFSRALQSAVTGTTDWTSQETPFFLQEGQKTDLVKLNVKIEGKGTVWVDRIVLAKSPL